MALEWMHCNKCYVKMKECPEMKLFFTNCAHIVCNKCYVPPSDSTSSSSKCLVCKKACSFLPVDGSLRSDLQPFFQDPRLLANKFTTDLKRVMDFQNFNRAHLAKYREAKMTNIEKAAAEVRDAVKKKPSVETIIRKRDEVLEKINKDNNEYRKVVEDMERKVRDMELKIQEQEAKLKNAQNRKHNALLRRKLNEREHRKSPRERSSSQGRKQVISPLAVEGSNKKGESPTATSPGSLFSSAACTSSSATAPSTSVKCSAPTVSRRNSGRKTTDTEMDPFAPRSSKDVMSTPMLLGLK